MADQPEPLSLCYMTPSHAPDLERFALLRRSLRLFSPGIRHLALIDTEDLALFRGRFGQEPNLEIIPTADVLPARAEAQRRFWRGRGGRLVHRLQWRLGGYTRHYSGWKLQQVVKLEAAARVPFDAVVFLDSDIFLCGPVTPADFVTEGALRFLETPAETFEDWAFEVSRQLLIRGGLGEPAEGYNYIHQAPRFLRRTARTLLDHLRATHADWTATFYAASFPSEYNLLGYAARVLEGFRDYCRDPVPRPDWVYEVKQREVLEEQLALCRAEQGRRKFFLIQSNMRLAPDAYLPAATTMIEALAARRAMADQG